PATEDIAMTHSIVTLILTVSQLLLLLAMGAAIIRMVRGPRAQDRVLALDALNVDVLLFLLSVGIRTGSMFYVEMVLIIAILGFASTAALAKFLMRGEVIE